MRRSTRRTSGSAARGAHHTAAPAKLATHHRGTTIGPGSGRAIHTRTTLPPAAAARQETFMSFDDDALQLDWDEASATLAAVSPWASPAELQGLLCGAVCADGQAPTDDGWLELVVVHGGEDLAATDATPLLSFRDRVLAGLVDDALPAASSGRRDAAVDAPGSPGPLVRWLPVGLRAPWRQHGRPRRGRRRLPGGSECHRAGGRRERGG